MAFRRAPGSAVEIRPTQRARRRPTVVAITGSYGKTTTRQYLAHLLA